MKGVGGLKTVYLYHTNDLHSHFDHWPQIVAFLKDARGRHEMRNEAVLQFDLGDHADRFHPLTEGTKGKGNVQLLNEAGYDGITIGNNEGITFSKTDFLRLYEQAAFPVVCANVFDTDGFRPSVMQPYRIYSLENGLRIGVIGVTIPFRSFYGPLGWEVKDPYELLPPLVSAIRKQCHMIVLLSHLGYHEDIEIASQLEGIDVILGAHTHHLLQEGKRVKETMIAQAGKFGAYCGQLKIKYDEKKKEIVDCEAYCTPMETYRRDEAAECLVKRLTETGKDQLRQEIVTLNETLHAEWFSPSHFASLLAEALREWCKAEIAMVNAGVLLGDLRRGPVTRGDVHRVLPHPINPCTVKISGEQLKETIRQAYTEEIERLELKGFGFRGKVLGRFVFNGVEIRTGKHRNGKPYVREVYFQRKPLNPKRHYELATFDTFTFGKMFPAISTAKEKRFFLPEMIRDILAWKLQALSSCHGFIPSS